MSFKKYPSIENHYQAKTVDKFRQEFPEVDNMQFVVLEKLDGANIQVHFEPNKPYKLGKRSSFIEEGTSFYDIWNTADKYTEQFALVQTTVDTTGVPVTIYGEIYGEGVQKRIDYGKGKQFVFFDVVIEEEFLPYNRMMVFLNEHQLPSPTVVMHQVHDEFSNTITGLENALKVDPSKLGKEVEGYVIRPFSCEINRTVGQRLIFKHKTAAFAEKMMVKHKEYEPIKDEVKDLQTIFLSYINENRVASAISKEGPIERAQQFGHYIKVILNDAKEDFFKDGHTIPEEFSHADEKRVFNVGQNIVAYLKKEL